MCVFSLDVGLSGIRAVVVGGINGPLNECRTAAQPGEQRALRESGGLGAKGLAMHGGKKSDPDRDDVGRY